MIRTPAQAFAAGYDAAADVPPLSQDQADYCAALLASVPQAGAAA